MKLVFILIIALCCYYTYTYGLHLWKKENNKLGGAATIILSVLATLIPAFIIWTRF